VTTSAHPVAREESGRSLRDTFARLPSGVCVITTDGPLGAHGMTASAVCSLSLDPALLLVCIDQRSSTLTAVRAHGRFAVNVLAADQTEASRAFAGRGEQAGRFARARHRRQDGVPVLEDSAAWLVCDVHELLSGGDHTIVVGQVRRQGRTDREPLVWHGGGYRRLVAAA
jgi:flavin reductase (DIM6/NTAB) family NADH-FMN oxidoreductase RutF